MPDDSSDSSATDQPQSSDSMTDASTAHQPPVGIDVPADNPDGYDREIDWATLFTYAGGFVAVTGVTLILIIRASRGEITQNNFNTLVLIAAILLGIAQRFLGPD